ncbi:MAG: chromosome segregation protein SMC [Alphaproteobacteria bacterium]|nr:chromosome segregation protein SMC [Alphaproteobacteria bacterium]
MIQFSSLRISGFKSFVDKTELEIGPGLNGIVGPNGCGKSNLVEALRWVMGETSAKRMRGSGMEDVIFSGTDQRSARNFAEVSLLLNNKTRNAPAAYNGHDDIEVTRRIERDRGSDYKINGKNARARDVQMLFADTVTGANSPSLVSQGHVTRMINSKPHERRLILEESAGIAGLYARRHEAEIRLKAADNNLSRVHDTLQSMESRLNQLKRQARQASKYKNLSAQIRQMELTIAYLEWRFMLDKQEKCSQDFVLAESLVAEKLITVTQLTKTQNTQAEDLPALRKKETELAAALQKYKLEFQNHEEEAARYIQNLKETKSQLEQAETDAKHETQSLEECARLLTQIETEHNNLIEDQKSDEDKLKKKQTECDDLKVKVANLEERFSSLKESAAEGRARKASLEKQIERNEENLEALQIRKTKATQEKNTLVIDENSQAAIHNLSDKIEKLEERISTKSKNTETLRSDLAATDELVEQARKDMSRAEKELAECVAEIKVLESFFEADNAGEFAPVIDDIATSPGYEKALSRALGNALMASLDTNAPSCWLDKAASKALPTLPSGITSIAQNVSAPSHLRAALSQIGIVPAGYDAEKLITQLQPGQSVVSVDGDLWRWDGYHVQASASDQQTIHLEQKNKLKELEQKQSKYKEVFDTAQQMFQKAADKQKTEKEKYEQLLSEIKNSENSLRELRPALTKIREKNLKIESEQKRYADQIESIDEDIQKLNITLENDRVAFNAMEQRAENEADNEDEIEDIKQQLEELREDYQNAVREFDRTEQIQSTRRARAQAIADDRVSLKNRSIRASEHMKTIKTRIEALKERLKELEENPVSLQGDHEKILNKISEMEAARNKAAEQLSAQENELAETTRALKEAESVLGTAREDRARTQAVLGSANEQLQVMVTVIKEQFQMPPEQLSQHAALDLAQYQPDNLVSLKQERDQLNRDRDAIGPVNLRAEGETEELEKELTTLLHERNDLVQAIEELRGAISKINKEAKERLNNAFDHVNAHFQNLFGRLFAGGKAYLELIEHDDPAQSGLEIYAQPPGKALQSLSLLSGGEQTLASIALIFAMFLTNPSPICVLDEIDAPLDDANVDRVCDLLEEIAERGETRFLIITHHRLSMARMDRLYGVTMSEKGVSQLVSVDLQQSFDFLDKKVA